MKLPEPPLLLITDRRQVRRTLVEVVVAALTSGCRWVSVREKDLPDSVHLPAGSDPQAARKLLGADKLVGVSIHSVDEAEAIDPTSVDYAVAGPAFETESKPGYGPEIGRKGLTEIASAARVPILAIGGLNVMRAGIAVMGGVMRSADPARVMRELLLVVAEARLQRG